MCKLSEPGSGGWRKALIFLCEPHQLLNQFASMFLFIFTQISFEEQTVPVFEPKWDLLLHLCHLLLLGLKACHFPRVDKLQPVLIQGSGAVLFPLVLPRSQKHRGSLP